MMAQAPAGAEIPLPIAQLLDAAWEDLKPAQREWGNPAAASELLARLTRAATTMGDLNLKLSDAPAEARPRLAAAVADLRHAVLALQGEISFASGFLESCSGRRAGGYSREGWRPAAAAHGMTVEG
jgi:hypothetical protein